MLRTDLLDINKKQETSNIIDFDVLEEHIKSEECANGYNTLILPRSYGISKDRCHNVWNT